jgi:hypothetical protein
MRHQALVPGRQLEQLPEKYQARCWCCSDVDGIQVKEIAALAELPRLPPCTTRLRRDRRGFEPGPTRCSRNPAPARRPGDACCWAWSGGRRPRRRRHAAASWPVPRHDWSAQPRGPRLPRPAGPRPRPWGALATALAASVILVATVAARQSRSARSPQPRAAALRARPGRGPAAQRCAQPFGSLAVRSRRAAAGGDGPGPRLVGRWSFDDAAGSAVAHDQSGHGHDCVLRGLDPSQVWGLAARAGGLAGAKGGSSVPRPTAVARGPVAVTVSLWVRRDASAPRPPRRNRQPRSRHTTDLVSPGP